MASPNKHELKQDTPRSDQPIFVVQRHNASSLHFDLRLEVDGALASWAVPKGPSLNPADKRLAVQVGDHDLDYADFEGRLGEGYGAGTVIVWDAGSYENVTEEQGSHVTMSDAVRGGHLKVVLHASKLTGAFSLRRTRMGGDAKNWLLIKVDDEGADRFRRPTESENRSVLTDRTNEDIAIGD